MANLNYKTKKLVAIILGDLVIIAALIIYFGLFRPHSPVKINGTYLTTPSTLAQFHFIDNHGMPFTKKNLTGHWSLIFFGFTHCALICPTTMTELNTMYKLLQHNLAQNQLPQVVFISVDPRRDTVAKLNAFVSSFNSHFMGVRANITATKAFEKQLHVTISNDNPMNHSMEIVLINPDAGVQAYFAYPHHAEQLASDYKLILNKS